jgi:hypothetical protein
MIFTRGDMVNYNPVNAPVSTFAGTLNGFPYGKNPYSPVPGTFVWAKTEHLGVAYVIEHPEGYPKERFLAGEGLPDGFESIHSSLLDDTKKYIYADHSELELIKRIKQ